MEETPAEQPKKEPFGNLRREIIVIALTLIIFTILFWLYPLFRFLSGILLLGQALALVGVIGRALELRVKELLSEEYDGIMREQRSFGALLYVLSALVILVGAVLAKARDWDKLSVTVLSMGFGIAVAYNFWLAGRCMVFLYSCRWEKADRWLSIGYVLSAIYCIATAMLMMMSLMNKGF